MTRESTVNKEGLGVDATGGPVVDPTANVIALTEAANRRQDDLRELSKELFHAEIRVLTAQMDGLEKRMILRSEHAKEIRQTDTEHAKEIRRK